MKLSFTPHTPVDRVRLMVAQRPDPTNHWATRRRLADQIKRGTLKQWTSQEK